MTNKELLRGFDLLCALAKGNLLYGRDKYGDMMINEIRALIENGPKVDEKFIVRWYDSIYFVARDKKWGLMAEIIKHMLQEAGVSVEGEK